MRQHRQIVNAIAQTGNFEDSLTKVIVLLDDYG
jgi:hypothetical protein